MYDGLSEAIAFAQNWGILHIRMNQKVDHMKMNLDYFQIQKWMLRTVRVEKLDEKNGVICLLSTFWVMALKCSKNLHFMQFCADLSKKRKSLKAISKYASQQSHHTLSGNGMVYRGLSHHRWDISN